MKVEKAIERLQNILPIKNRLDDMDIDLATIYLAVVNSFYDKGRVAALSELETIHSDARDIVAKLGKQDMLTLDESGEVKGCYPFTMEKRVHRIQLNGFEVHAMCAMDALAPSSMFECSSVILSGCEVTAEPIRIELNNQTIVNLDEVGDVHFGMNWMAASSCGSCADSLCTEMLFLMDQKTATTWLNDDAVNREIFTLSDAVKFATGFFKPMMQQG